MRQRAREGGAASKMMSVNMVSAVRECVGNRGTESW